MCMADKECIRQIIDQDTNIALTNNGVSLNMDDLSGERDFYSKYRSIYNCDLEEEQGVIAAPDRVIEEKYRRSPGVVQSFVSNTIRYPREFISAVSSVISLLIPRDELFSSIMCVPLYLNPERETSVISSP